jgi:hypothetical protein
LSRACYDTLIGWDVDPGSIFHKVSRCAFALTLLLFLYKWFQFTVLRELIQNADDAKGTEVFIRFETQDFIDGHETAQYPDLETSAVRKPKQ